MSLRHPVSTDNLVHSQKKKSRRDLDTRKQTYATDQRKESNQTK